MKTIDRRKIGFAIAIFALVSGMIAVAPATAQAAHAQKKGAVESRGTREFLKRLDRAGHDHRILDRRFFRNLERAGRTSRKWRVFSEYLLAGRLDWYRAEASRHWVRANYPAHYAKHVAALAPRVFVRVRGAPRLGEAVRYALMNAGRGRNVIFVGRPGRADLIVEVDGLISDPYRGPGKRSGKKLKRKKRGPVRVDYDLVLTLRAGAIVFERERARGRVKGAAFEDRLVRALAHEVLDLRYPSRRKLWRIAARGARYSKGPVAKRGWRSGN
jgi:hypothetical protein